MGNYGEDTFTWPQKVAEHTKVAPQQILKSVAFLPFARRVGNAPRQQAHETSGGGHPPPPALCSPTEGQAGCTAVLRPSKGILQPLEGH